MFSLYVHFVTKQVISQKMEGKTVILGVIIMSLVMAQNQVEAKICCPRTIDRNIYNACRLTGASMTNCANLSGCKIVSGTTCPPGYTHDILQNYGNLISFFLVVLLSYIFYKLDQDLDASCKDCFYF